MDAIQQICAALRHIISSGNYIVVLSLGSEDTTICVYRRKPEWSPMDISSLDLVFELLEEMDWEQIIVSARYDPPMTEVLSTVSVPDSFTSEDYGRIISRIDGEEFSLG
jgi:hypothetical protein